MSKSKTSTPRPSFVHKFAGFLGGRGRPLTAAAILLGGFFGTWYYVWAGVRGHVLASPDYVLTAKSIEITPLPPWIHSDVREEVFGAAQFGGPLSILDDNLTERLASAFSLHPWVAKVRRVAKKYPAKVEVDIEYRQPVLMVDTPNGLLPVDAQGVLLPGGDFSPVEQSRYPRLVGVETQPMGTLGERWGDPRVLGAAQIAAAVGGNWSPWRLDRIVPSVKPASNAAEDYVYMLVARSGTQIYWGRAPHTNVAGELPPTEKVARLTQYIATNGTFDGRDGPQQLDLRTLRRP